MYYDELLDANEDNFVLQMQNKELNKIKSLDKGYASVYRYKPGLNGKNKLCKVDLYVSGDAGTYIRNAMTGENYKYKVGTKYEELLFKTKIATGEVKTTSGNSLLFYDSPEQFESHLMEPIDQEIKENWRIKNAEFLQKV
jgi:hypothetical protein